MNALPDKPSELIRVAVADLMRAEKLSEEYLVDMSDWHVPRITYKIVDGAEVVKSVCSVCLAGSVMAGTLGTNVEWNASPGDLQDANTRHKLYFLDSVRNFVSRSTWLTTFGVKSWDSLGKLFASVYSDGWATGVPSYSYDKEGFKSRLLEIADKLETVGL